MKEIELGFGYKIVRRDPRNWELMHWHECNGSNNPKLNSGKAKWHNCGRFYQTLDTVLRAVYELVLREGDERVELCDALERAERIAATLNRKIDLLGLGDAR